MYENIAQEFRIHKLPPVWSGTLILLLALACVLPVFSQSDAARLQGVITDQTQALVPAAKVKVTELATNRVLETETAPDSGA
ncbi:MAG: hypothetical protein ABI759_07940 [Candidatus Solibacter sp.]